MIRAFSNRNREGSNGEDYPEPSENDRLRTQNAALVGMLGKWLELYGDVRRGISPLVDETRDAIAAAEKGEE